MDSRPKKRVDSFWDSKILIDDGVHKGHTKLNMFSLCVKQIKSLCRKQSKFNLLIRLYPKSARLCHLLIQVASWQPNNTVLTYCVKALLKAMTDTVFWGPSLGVVRISIYDGRLFFNNNREYFEAACPGLVICSNHYSWI